MKISFTNAESVGAAPRALISSLPVVAPTRQAAEQRARILYVDDELPLRKLGELALVRAGYAVNTAADGALAWEELQHTQYNLLITDNNMPRLTGLELACNARLAGMRLPIVMTSGSPEPLHDREYAWLDLAAFMPKPYGFEALVATVERALRAANDRVSAQLPASVQSWMHGGINE
jgi:DNA-binding response OmpR family regulator